MRTPVVSKEEGNNLLQRRVKLGVRGNDSVFVEIPKGGNSDEWFGIGKNAASK